MAVPESGWITPAIRFSNVVFSLPLGYCFRPWDGLAGLHASKTTEPRQLYLALLESDNGRAVVHCGHEFNVDVQFLTQV